jgi:alpha-glucosidase
MNKIKYLILFLSLISSGYIQAKKVEIVSPDQQLKVTVNTEKEINYSVKYKNTEIMVNCPASLTLGEGKVLGKEAVLLRSKEITIQQEIRSAIPCKNAVITDHCTETTLLFKGNYSMVFRVYDTGFAYRFVTSLKDQIEVVEENVGLNFSNDMVTWFPEEKGFMSHYESLYPKLKLNEISDPRMCCLPVLFQTQSGVNVLFSETDLTDYPNLFLKGTGKNNMTGIQPRVISKIIDLASRSDRTEVIEAEENFIAKTIGTRSFPWRTFIVSDKDADIVASEINFILAGKQKLENTSWIKPGKVAWDWWNANNIYHVDFKSGLNNNTYKYFIDFASAFGLEYIILDEGWSKTTTNLLECAKDIDVEELVNYGKEKNVGVILWLLWKPLDKDMNNILDLYKKWGVKGIKVDFMQRADQYMVNYYERVAKATAQREMLVDFHGAFKPSGLQRVYPNAINFEGVRGNENNKWSEEITPLHTVTLPFTRMTAGPMDFTPGSMNNASAKDFAISFNRPMSMGTRAHQVAMYVVYESPLQMLCESPTEYYREKECAEFISKIPTVWDETKVIKASIAEYIVVARRSGNKWYLGGMTNDTPRSFEIDLSFLPEGTLDIISLSDGMNTNMNARDYKLIDTKITNKTNFKVEMASGGGFTAIITL